MDARAPSPLDVHGGAASICLATDAATAATTAATEASPALMRSAIDNGRGVLAASAVLGVVLVCVDQSGSHDDVAAVGCWIVMVPLGGTRADSGTSACAAASASDSAGGGAEGSKFSSIMALRVDSCRTAVA